MTNIKKIAIIGAGGIAKSVHIPSLQKTPEAAIQAVCDAIPQRAKEAAAFFPGASWYDNYHIMLEKEDLDGVFVLVQPDQSFRIVSDMMRAGLDVFCEKPAGITLFQLESLKRLQEETKVLLQVGFNRRFIPLVQKVVELISPFGPLTQVGGCFFKNSSASFYDGCASSLECDVVHVADLLCFFTGSPATEAKTVTSQVESPVVNSWNSAIYFENGATGTIRSNYATGGRVHTFELHNSQVSVYLNLGFGTAECTADIIYFNGEKSFSLASTGINTKQIHHLDGAELAESQDYYRYYGYYAEDLEFLHCMESRKAPACGIDEAIHAMKLIDLIKAGIF